MGAWQLDAEYANLESETGAIRIAFSANKVNLVAGADTSTPIRAQVFVDGEFVQEVSIRAYELYNLVDLGDVYGDHILEIRFLNTGVRAFAFTFG